MARDPGDLLGSIERLIAAGIVASNAYDARADRGTLRWTPAFHRLLLAGRRVEHEPGFQRAWRTGDPRVVRAWIEGEAAALGGPPVSPAGANEARSDDQEEMSGDG